MKLYVQNNFHQISVNVILLLADYETLQKNFTKIIEKKTVKKAYNRNY